MKWAQTYKRADQRAFRTITYQKFPRPAFTIDIRRLSLQCVTVFCAPAKKHLPQIRSTITTGSFMIQMLRKSGIIALLALACWAGSALPAWARSEYEVKAAYLYNFIKFIAWPEGSIPADAPLNLCVFGEDPFQAILQPMSKLKAQGHVLNIRYPSGRDDIGNCHVLYISPSENKFVEEMLAQAHANNTLTVSDMKDFTRMGGMIGFVTVGNVIRFQINLAVARASGLQISTKLLELAQEVTQ